MAKKLKDVVKMNPEPAKGRFGVDPTDPWSTKANINEVASLHQYLMSRGINPKFVSKETKISHAKSSAFIKWKQDHQFEEVQIMVEDAMLDKFLSSRGINPRFVTKDVKISHAKSGEFEKWKRDHMFESVEILEATDKEDVVTLNIPLVIRMLELAREDIKSDADLHRVIEKLIQIRNKGVLTMDDYSFVSGIKEECDRLNEEDPCWTGYTQVGMKKKGGREVPNCVPSKGVEKAKGYKEEVKEAKTIQGTALDKFRQAAAERAKKHADIEAQMKARHAAGKEDMKGAIDRLEKHLNKEDVFQDPQAATQTVFDGANNTNDTSERKMQLSKSARMIKSLYKHLNMKEDTYDWEKADKSVQTYGKKPKLKEPAEETNFGERVPSARVVMSGGTTLTGETRDTVEIDPEMKKRPGPETFGPTGKKASQQ